MRKRSVNGSNIKAILYSISLPVFILIVWEFFAYKVNNPALIPRIDAVLLRLADPFGDLIGTGHLVNHIAASVIRVLFGYLLALVVGIPLGLLVGRNDTIMSIVNPVVEFIRPICPIAWIPVTLVLFKMTTVSDLFGVHFTRSVFGHIQIGMLAVIFIGGFFPLFVNTVYGVKSVKEIYIESAKLLGCNNHMLFRKVIFPSALPSILTGVRIGLGNAWMVIIAAEMIPGSMRGLGYLIMYSYSLADMDIMLACIIIIGCIGSLLSHSIQIIANRTSKWQARER